MSGEGSVVAGDGASGARRGGPADRGSGATGPATRSRLRSVLGAATVVLGVAATVVAGLVAVAPVESTVSILSWPRATDAPESPASTTAFLVPYRAAELHADVPCTALREAQRRAGSTVILSTTTADATRGLVVRADGGTVRLLANGRSTTLDLPSGGGCGVRVDAGDGGLRVTAGGAPLVTRPDGSVPEVFAITTDLAGAPARGLRLTARTPAWFDNAASPAKLALIRAQLDLATIAFGLLVVIGVLDQGFRPRTGRADARSILRCAGNRCADAVRRPAAWGLAAVDAGVIAGLAWWSLVGPMTDDDGFAATIAGAAPFGGPVSNHYRWFDASEAPFASSQQLLRLFLDRGPDPLFLRTPSMLAGVAVWFLLTRGVLRAGLGGRAGSSVTVRLLTAVVLAAWWFPYDLGTRPEPLVALGAATVLALTLRAVRVGAPRGRPELVLAVGVAAATLTVAPSGVVALAPFLLLAPGLLEVLRGGRRGSGGAARAVEGLAVAIGLVSMSATVVFAAQSWHGLAVATSIHQQWGPAQPWYAEWLRYGYLLGDDSWGSATKRLPVLLTLALAATALLLLARSGRAATGPETDRNRALLGLAPTAFALLALTPSKWSHHFGALAGFGTVTVVVLVVALVRLARSPDARDARGLGVLSAVGVAVAAALSFSGPNAWWGYSNAHVPWSTGPVSPVADIGGWLATGAVGAVLVASLARWRGDRGAPGEATAAACVTAPVVLALLGAVASVGVLTSSFAAAADPPAGTWSLGARNLTVARDPASPAACGLENSVQVLTTARGGPLVPAGGADPITSAVDGFVEQGGWDAPPPKRPDQADGSRDDRYAWGSKRPGTSSVGTVTSPWFALDRLGGTQELAIGVAGRTTEAMSVDLEFGRSGRGPTTTSTSLRVTEPPAPERGYRGYARDDEQARLQDQHRSLSAWRTITVPAAEIPPGTDRVRVLARDERTDTDGWVAVTGPRVVDVTPLPAYLASRTPVVVDWAVAFAWPCAGPRARVEHGVTQAPAVLVSTPPDTNDPLPGGRTVDDTRPDDVVPERWTLGTEGLVTSVDNGASLAGMRQTADLLEVDTRLAGDPGRVWGRILVPDYRGLEVDAYDLRTVTILRDGTQGDPAPARAPRDADG